jgi:hypothetical protein
MRLRFQRSFHQRDLAQLDATAISTALALVLLAELPNNPVAALLLPWKQRNQDKAATFFKCVVPCDAGRLLGDPGFQGRFKATTVEHEKVVACGINVT